MIQWVLVLTMTMFGGQYNAMSSSQAIHSVGGFSTQESCLAAGNAWLKQQREISSVIHRREARALCVQVAAVQ